MEHDIFFSISQTPDHQGHVPDEATMLLNFFQQLDCADKLGFGIGWIAKPTSRRKPRTEPSDPWCRTGRGLASARTSRNWLWNRFVEHPTSK